MSGLNYYCDKSLQDNDDSKWKLLLQIVISEANFVEFNIFRQEYVNIPEITKISNNVIESYKRKKKIYRHGEIIRYKLNDEVIEFISNKSFAEWRNYYFEDISFLKDDLEILATITHENYVIVLLNENQLSDLNAKGYNFEFFLATDFY